MCKDLLQSCGWQKPNHINAIFYITHSGCPWRLMPHEFPHWRLVYYYFAKWQKEGVWEKPDAALRDHVRTKAGKKAPTAVALDSQSVKTAGQRGERGFEAGKKVLGRAERSETDWPQASPHAGKSYHEGAE